MTTLYLIRHGEAEGNPEGRFLGQQDVPLTLRGHEQAAALAQRLADLPLTAVYSSDLRRAMQTAAALAAQRGLAVQPCPALREAAFGRWSGMTYAEIEAGWPEACAAWLAEPERTAPPDGECLADLRLRAMQALDALAALHAGESVAVVTHGGVLGALLTGWLGPDAWREPVRNAAVLTVHRTPWGWQVERELPHAFAAAGWRLWRQGQGLVLSAPAPCRALSSAVVGAGVQTVQHVLCQHVLKDYCCDDPPADLARTAGALGLPPQGWLGFMTAVRLHHAAVILEEEAGLRVLALVTAGVSNAAAAGTPPPPVLTQPRPGTINIVLVVDAALAPGAQVGAIITATEAKAQALRDRGVRDAAGNLATGTTTDALAVLATGHGTAQLPYAGPATLLGGLIGRAVYRGVGAALAR